MDYLFNNFNYLRDCLNRSSNLSHMSLNYDWLDSLSIDFRCDNFGCICIKCHSLFFYYNFLFNWLNNFDCLHFHSFNNRCHIFDLRLEYFNLLSNSNYFFSNLYLWLVNNDSLSNICNFMSLNINNWHNYFNSLNYFGNYFSDDWYFRFNSFSLSHNSSLCLRRYINWSYFLNNNCFNSLDNFNNLSWDWFSEVNSLDFNNINNRFCCMNSWLDNFNYSWGSNSFINNWYLGLFHMDYLFNNVNNFSECFRLNHFGHMSFYNKRLDLLCGDFWCNHFGCNGVVSNSLLFYDNFLFKWLDNLNFLHLNSFNNCGDIFDLWLNNFNLLSDSDDFFFDLNLWLMNNNSLSNIFNFMSLNINNWHNYFNSLNHFGKDLSNNRSFLLNSSGFSHNGCMGFRSLSYGSYFLNNNSFNGLSYINNFGGDWLCEVYSLSLNYFDYWLGSVNGWLHNFNHSCSCNCLIDSRDLSWCNSNFGFNDFDNFFWQESWNFLVGNSCLKNLLNHFGVDNNILHFNSWLDLISFDFLLGLFHNNCFSNNFNSLSISLWGIDLLGNDFSLCDNLIENNSVHNWLNSSSFNSLFNFNSLAESLNRRLDNLGFFNNFMDLYNFWGNLYLWLLHNNGLWYLHFFNDFSSNLEFGLLDLTRYNFYGFLNNLSFYHFGSHNVECHWGLLDYYFGTRNFSHDDLLGHFWLNLLNFGLCDDNFFLNNINLWRNDFHSFFKDLYINDFFCDFGFNLLFNDFLDSFNDLDVLDNWSNSFSFYNFFKLNHFASCLHLNWSNEFCDDFFFNFNDFFCRSDLWLDMVHNLSDFNSLLHHFNLWLHDLHCLSNSSSDILHINLGLKNLYFSHDFLDLGLDINFGSYYFGALDFDDGLSYASYCVVHLGDVNLSYDSLNCFLDNFWVNWLFKLDGFGFCDVDGLFNSLNSWLNNLDSCGWNYSLVNCLDLGNDGHLSFCHNGMWDVLNWHDNFSDFSFDLCLNDLIYDLWLYDFLDYSLVDLNYLLSACNWLNHLNVLHFSHGYGLVHSWDCWSDDGYFFSCNNGFIDNFYSGFLDNHSLNHSLNNFACLFDLRNNYLKSLNFLCNDFLSKCDAWLLNYNGLDAWLLDDDFFNNFFNQGLDFTWNRHILALSLGLLNLNHSFLWDFSTADLNLWFGDVHLCLWTISEGSEYVQSEDLRSHCVDGLGHGHQFVWVRDVYYLLNTERSTDLNGLNFKDVNFIIVSADFLLDDFDGSDGNQGVVDNFDARLRELVYCLVFVAFAWAIAPFFLLMSMSFDSFSLDNSFSQLAWISLRLMSLCDDSFDNFDCLLVSILYGNRHQRSYFHSFYCVDHLGCSLDGWGSYCVGS